MTPSRVSQPTRTLIARQRRRREAVGGGPGDEGSAIVEFLGATLILLVPTVYLVLVLGRLQAASYAVDGAARESVRAFLTAHDDERGAQRAQAAAGVAVKDQGFTAEQAVDGLTVTCASEPCSAPGGIVHAAVTLEVDLPGVPGWLADVVPLHVTVAGEATGAMDDYAAEGAG